jgi:hypothetical protein
MCVFEAFERMDAQDKTMEALKKKLVTPCFRNHGLKYETKV